LNIFEAVILGLVQGLTEFLPISSSAHVQIASQLLGLGDIPKPELTAFIATIQLGTEAAVLIYFFKDIVRIVRAWFKSFAQKSKSTDAEKQDAKMGWLIIVGSMPVVVVGLLFKDAIETQLRSLWVIAIMLIVFGVILGIADRVATQQKSIQKLSVRDGLLFGAAQALAVIPGVSRSGGTITMGLFLGYSRQAAARYSFLLAIPAVIASGLFEFATTFGDLSHADFAATAVATAVSFAVGFSVIVALLRYLSRGSFMPFIIWRIVVGVAILVMLMNGSLVA
jgi:undecaprenyl-diphosphatase